MGTGIRLSGAVALALALVTGAGAAEAPHKLVLAGDSTMQKRPAEGPAGSWGEALAPALKEGFEIANFARGGRSTRGNCVPCCKECNNKKKAYTPAEQILNQLFPEGVEP